MGETTLTRGIHPGYHSLDVCIRHSANVCCLELISVDFFMP